MTKTLLQIVFILGLVMILAVVGTALGLYAFTGTAPDQLVRWTDTSLGFVFGILSALVKTWSDKE